MKEIKLVLVEAGDFTMGSTKKDIEQIRKSFPDFEPRLLERETPQHKIFLKAFKISKYPITNSEFHEFIQNSKYPFVLNSNLKNKERHPVVQVSWFDAVEFCKWLTKKTGHQYRLPTEAEWEKAARGTDGRIFPWGNKWEPTFCNSENQFKETTPVDYFEKNNVSPYGCVDMCGNVFEWTSTTIGNTEPWPSKYTYPYSPNDGRENLKTKTRRVGRGGAYSRNWIYCRNTFRFADLPNDKYPTQGFRIVCEV